MKGMEGWALGRSRSQDSWEFASGNVANALELYAVRVQASSIFLKTGFARQMVRQLA